MAMVRYSIETRIRKRNKNVEMKYFTIELSENVEVDLGVELDRDLAPNGREDSLEIVTLEVSSVRMYDVEIEVETLPVELLDVLISEAMAMGGVDSLNSVH